MIQDLSAIGTKFTIYCIPTFPQGITLTLLPGETDPLTSAEMQLATWKTGVNGDLILYRQASGFEITLGTIAGTEDDMAMEILFEANRIGKNKIAYHDTITLVAQYPDMTRVLTNGAIVKGTPLINISADGQKKGRNWTFVFEGRVS